MARANVLLLLTGGIAAYKSCTLTRLLIQAGFSVRVGMTRSARRFVGEVTLRSLSGHAVATDLWGEGDTDPLDHIELPRWADLVVVAPATANLLGKAANGIADDLVTTFLLANEAPLLLAPAMNDVMWRHPAVQKNLTVLRKQGAEVVGPDSGFLACGTEDTGRMSEPEEICARVCEMARGLPRDLVAETPTADRPLAGRTVLVTAGPTREPLDAIRFISNRSTGGMGFAMARRAAALGADVSLIHGPVDPPPPCTLSRVQRVETAADMAAAVREQLPRADVLIMSAAVADFAPMQVAVGKAKKEVLGTSWTVEMTRTTDILAEIVDKRKQPGLLVVGFALETENLIARAGEKLQTKGLDLVVANKHSPRQSAFGQGLHQVTLIDREGVVWESGETGKDELAHDLWARLIPRMADPADDS